MEWYAKQSRRRGESQSHPALADKKMIEQQLEGTALRLHPPEKQLRKGTQDGKGFCRREARGGLEHVEKSKSKIERNLCRIFEWGPVPRTSSWMPGPG